MRGKLMLDPTNYSGASLSSGANLTGHASTKRLEALSANPKKGNNIVGSPAMIQCFFFKSNITARMHLVLF
jgi:hypothetical protein